MKRTATNFGLLFAACILLLSNVIAFADDKTQAVKSSQVVRPDANQIKNDAKADQQLKDLVKKRRTRNGWLGDGTVADNVRVLKDLSYVDKDGSQAQKLDLYIPSVHTIAGDDTASFEKSNSNFADKRQNLSKGWPIVVWIHGGGWRSGDKKGGPFRALLDAGFAVASINYRLSPEAKWPAQLDDCRSALSFLRNHASEYDIDCKRMGLWGASAGGHLVLMLALKPEGANKAVSQSAPETVSAVCDWFGPTDLGGFMRKGETTNSGAEMIQQLFGLEGDALLAACDRASPITYVGVGQLQQVPPMLIMHGKSDRLVSIHQSYSLVDKMKAAGVKNVKLVELNGGHGFPGFGPGTVLSVVNFFKDKLNK